MELAVLKYQYVTNPPENMPSEWPAEVREIADGAALPGANWVRMTCEQFRTHKQTYQADYDTWWRNNKSSHVSNQPDPYAS